MTSATGSTPPSGRRSRRPGAVGKAILVTHGRVDQVGAAVARLVATTRAAGVELVITPDESEKHGLPAAGDATGAELVIVLGGDGTMLRTLQRYLGTGIPVLGVNFGRVGFLSSIGRESLEEGIRRAVAGELEVVELPTLAVEIEGRTAVAVNDVVVTSGQLGRMVELEWTVGGEDLGRVRCDGLICSSPSGSTAYNLSNGGPVLVWGLEAMAVTFVAPHSLHARPLVVPRGTDVVVWNRTVDVEAAVLVDGHRIGDAEHDAAVTVGIGSTPSLLGTLPEATFVSRYRNSFGT